MITVLGPMTIRNGFPAMFGAQGYTGTVTFSAALGTIDSATGAYTAPAILNYVQPALNVETITATDSDSNVGTLSVGIVDPLGLVGDIISNQLGLSNGQVYFYNQKIMIPTDARMYVSIGVQSVKIFGNTNEFDDGNSNQWASCLTTLKIDILSRTIEALIRKEQVVMAFNSTYAQQQMAANSFQISRLSSQFVNLSEGDGSAIPYRFNISCNLTYAAFVDQDVGYYDTFSDTVATNP